LDRFTCSDAGLEAVSEDGFVAVPDTDFAVPVGATAAKEPLPQFCDGSGDEDLGSAFVMRASSLSNSSPCLSWVCRISASVVDSELSSVDVLLLDKSNMPSMKRAQ
jgi:hypothetical protein